MIGKLLDSLAGVISPKWGANRAAWRLQHSRVNAVASDHQMLRKMMSSRQGGYEAGKTHRLTNRMQGSAHENDLDRNQINIMKWRSWNLYRNNPQARKICRTLGAKVIGRGLSPQPQASNADGTPFVEFRKRARHIWKEFSKECDFRGKPGRGGQHLITLQKTAFRAVILSGGVFGRFHHLSEKDAKAKGLLVPLQIRLIHADRLDETKNGSGNFNGVELDQEGRAKAYWIFKGGIQPEGATKIESIPVSADKMIHLFAEEDIDQILGSPWFGAALLTMDDRRSYEASELTAAEMASCIVGVYSQSPGQAGGIGLPNPDSNLDLTDKDGNTLTRLQAGMFINTGSSGKVEIVGGNRPNVNAEPFCSHLVRSEAVAMPGVKSSTLTGDYRNSSFSSERSADNDVWPEIEELQDWFSIGFCQPIYEEVISTAVTAGLFKDVEGFSAEDFNDRRREYLQTNWQGPVARSINPKDDAAAASMRVKSLNSTPQIEAGMIGRDWRENIDGIAEFIAYCVEREIPEDIWQQALGIEQKDEPDSTEPAQDAATAALRMRASA